MAFSEIIRFVLPSQRKSEFHKLRQNLTIYGGVKAQYFGDMIAPSNAALPFKKNEMCWVIRTFSHFSAVFVFLLLTLGYRLAA